MKTLALMIFGLLLVSCSDHEVGPPPHGEIGVAVAPVSLTGNGLANAGPTTAISGGANTLGVSAPTAEGVAGRIANGLEGNAPSTAGNFAATYAQVKTNLPKVSNVTSAAGYDQVQLLAYAACADLTTGGTPRMQSAYGVKASDTIAASQTALVAAGVRIMDQFSAGLASQGPASAQVITVFTNLVQTEAATATNTTTMAFMAVCLAATTAGSTLLGM